MRNVLLILVLILVPSMSSAQFSFGPAQSAKILASQLPACTATTPSDYTIIDPLDANACTGGAATPYAELNWCVCDKNTLNWKVLVSTIGASGGAVTSVHGRTGAVVSQTNDYSISQVTGGIASSTLASQANAQGASLIGVEDAAGNFTAIDVEAALAELDALRTTHAANASAHHVATVDTNAQTLCAGSESLRGDGTCAVPSGGGFTPNADPGIDHSGYATHTGDANAHHVPTVDTNATNLGATPTATTVTITSDTGGGALIPQAGATAGVISAADQTKLDGIAPGAQVDTDTNAATICGTGLVLGGAADGCVPSGSANPLTTVSCSGGVSTIPGTSGTYQVDNTCSAGDTIRLSAVGALDASDGKQIAVINNSGASLTLDAATNNPGSVIESGSLTVPSDSTFSAIQTAANVFEVIGTGSGGGTPFDLCRGGAKGGGLDSTTGLYAWTCGNYNWSAEVGGIDGNGVSDYNTPTTVGGNSWRLNCTGDGTASNGTVQEGTICTSDMSGKSVKMYSEPDFMLAHDNTRSGGKIYVPNDFYHMRYCGQSSSGVANGCPVGKQDPSYQIRKLQQWGGREFVFEGADFNGPTQDGSTSTWLLLDYGIDSDDNNGNGMQGTTDPGGVAGWTPGHWAIKVGLMGNTFQNTMCAWPTDSTTGCVTTDPNAVSRSFRSASPLGRGNSSDALITSQGSNAIGNALGYLCVDDDIANSGLCSAPGTGFEYQVRCDTNTGGRTSAISGGCPGILGTCVSYYDALEAIHNSRPDDDPVQIVIVSQNQPLYGSNSGGSASTQSSLATVSGFTNPSGSCSAGTAGRVEIGGILNPVDRFHFMAASDYVLGTSPLYIYMVEQSTFYNVGGGYRDFSVRPGSWVGRDSATAAADCLNTTGSTYAACDETEMVALGSGVGGHIDGAAIWFGMGGQGYSFSAVDGGTSGFGTALKNSVIAYGRGTAMDASGWLLENNLWTGWSGTQPLLAYAFSEGFRQSGDRIWNNGADSIWSGKGATNARIVDIELVGNDTGVAIFRAQSMKRTVYDGITGYGNKGPLVYLDPLTGEDVFDLTVRNVHLGSHAHNSAVASAPKGIITRYDANGSGTFNGQLKGVVNFDDIHVTVHGDDDWCMVFFEGLTGDESSPAEGSGRNVDDDRDALRFTNMTMEVTSDGTKTGTQRAFCLGNSGSTSTNGPEDVAVLDLFSASGPLPYVSGLMVDNVKFPDILQSSIDESDLPLANAMVDNSQVLVHGVASGCAHVGGNLTAGTNTIWCTNDSGANTWAVSSR